MGEPARRLDDDLNPAKRRQPGSARERAERSWGMSGGDEQDSSEPETSERPSLQALPGGGETTSGRGSLRSAGQDELASREQSSSQPGRTFDDTSERQSLSEANRTKEDGEKKEAKDKEGAPRPFNDKENKQIAFVQKHKKKIMAGTVGGLFSIPLIAGLLWFNSLKTFSFWNVLQGKLFSSTEDMADKGSEALFQHYVEKKVIPGMVANNCASTRVDKTCSLKTDGDDPLSKMFNIWHDSRLERRMAVDYGIEIVRTGNGYSIRNARYLGQDITITDGSDWLNGQSASEARRDLKSILKQNTKRRQILFRYQVASLAERKYGIRRCMALCENRDARKERREVKRQARKAWFVERFVAPRSEAHALLLNCVLVNFSCADDPQTQDDGRRPTQFERDLQVKLTALRSTMGVEKIEQIAKNADEIKKNGLVFYVVKKLTNEAIAKLLTKWVPIAGQIDALTDFIEAMKNAGPALAVITYAMNTAQNIGAYSTLATAASEITANTTDSDLAGQAAGFLKANPQGDNGTADAAASRLFQRYNNTPDSTSIASIIFPKASAATEIPTVKCNNQRSQGEQGGCDEYDQTGLTALGAILSGTSAALTSPVGAGLTLPATIWSNTVGLLFDAFGWLVGLVLDTIGVGRLSAWIGTHLKDVVQPALDYAANVLVQRCLSQDEDKSVGWRFIDCATIGGAALNAEMALMEYGGYTLTPAQFFAINQERDAEARYAFEQQSLWSRITNVQESRSLVSQLAIASPSSIGDVASGVASFGSLFNLGNIFGSFLTKPASAADSPEDMPEVAIMHIPLRGRVKNDPIYKELRDNGPAAWKAHKCDDPAIDKNWGDSLVQDPKSRQWEAGPGNGNDCKFMKRLACINGVWNAQLPEDVCTKDELYGANANAAAAAPPPTNSGALTCANEDPKTLARQIQDSPNVDTSFSDSVANDLRLTVAGQPGTSGDRISAAILCVVLTMSKNHKFFLTALESNGGGHSADSLHYTGDAADFDNIDGIPLNRNEPLPAPAVTVIKEMAPMLPKGSGIGQVQCGNFPDSSIPAGISTFSDPCNHLHIQVPRQSP